MDSKTETVSANAMIAEFMAAKNHINESERKEYLLLDAPKGFSGDCWYEVGNVRYHTSWDWLMPVVEKIETLVPTKFSITTGYVEISPLGPYNQKIFTNCSHEGSKIKACYKAVVEFIRWYNSQSPDTIK